MGFYFLYFVSNHLVSQWKTWTWIFVCCGWQTRLTSFSKPKSACKHFKLVCYLQLTHTEIHKENITFVDSVECGHICGWFYYQGKSLTVYNTKCHVKMWFNREIDCNKRKKKTNIISFWFHFYLMLSISLTWINVSKEERKKNNVNWFIIAGPNVCCVDQKFLGTLWSIDKWIFTIIQDTRRKLVTNFLLIFFFSR